VIRQLAVIVLLSGSIVRGSEPAGVTQLCRYWAEYYARAYHVPVELVDAVIEVESDWNPYAVSSTGATGLMQLTPGTAVRFGVWNRFHVKENVRAGVAYLAWLINLFHGDLRLATAAYLVGESRIESRGLAYSSPEVYSYVSRVARIYRARRLESVRRDGTGEEVER
jgi:soluble lytic murein transglycosylase-like protein